MKHVGAPSAGSFRENDRLCIERALAAGNLTREGEWTEGLAVGSEAYVKKVGKMVDHRRTCRQARMKYDRLSLGAPYSVPGKREDRQGAPGRWSKA